MTDLSRREALKMAIGAAAGLTVSRGLSAATESVAAGAEKKVRVGFIGVGDRGTGLLRVMLAFPGVEIPAVCDINKVNLKRAQDWTRDNVAEASLRQMHNLREDSVRLKRLFISQMRENVFVKSLVGVTESSEQDSARRP